MKDIQVISNHYVHGSFQLLSDSRDRARSALYFAKECSKNANREDAELARCYARASLSEFKSIFEVLNADLRTMGLDKIWERSPFKGDLEGNALVKILKKARDLATHSMKLPGIHKAVQVYFPNEDGGKTEDKSYLFFNEITRAMFFQPVDYISDDELAWFNHQAITWPIDLLVREAVYQSSQPLASFLISNHGRITV